LVEHFEEGLELGKKSKISGCCSRYFRGNTRLVEIILTLPKNTESHFERVKWLFLF
jgi:hypothetical protein